MDGTISRKILLVDDDENVLQGYYRNLSRLFPIEVAMGGEQALQAMEDHGPFAVVVADMRMPGMDGLELLKIIKERWPEVIRVMLTGNADQGTAMDAVNQGEVFRFLTKPYSPDLMKTVLLAALRQHHLQQSEKILLERTLMGSLRVLTELIGFANPEASHLAQLTRERVRALGAGMGLESTWDLEAAALLAPIGQAMLPMSLRSKLRERKPLSISEHTMLTRVPEFGARLVENIPRMERVANLIRLQAAEGGGDREATLLWLVSEFSRRDQERHDALVVLEEMRLQLDAALAGPLAAMARLFTPVPALPERSLPHDQIPEGSLLAKDILDPAGNPILMRGLRLDRAHLDLIGALINLRVVTDPIHISD
nr:response regulator [uncultured Holophaga sp.]